MRWFVWLTLGGAAALRLLAASAPQMGFELQEAYPRAAVMAVVDGIWSSPFLSHGPALFLLLRALCTVWYALGWLGGLYETRLDVLAAFATDPQPFVVAGRLVVIATALLGVWLVWRLGRALFGSTAGVVGAAFLAVMFAHVRESYHVWPDVPAGTAAIAAAWASVVAWRTGTVVTSAWAGGLGGLAIATKPSVFPIAFTVALAAWGGRADDRGRRLLAAVGVALAVLAASAPGRFLHPVVTFRRFILQSHVTFTPWVQGLDWATYVHVGLGWPMALLAIAGLVASLRGPGRVERLLVAVFIGVYAIALSRAGFRYVRYLAPVAPFLAVLAGYGATVVVARLPSRARVVALLVVVLMATGEQALAAARLGLLLRRPDTRILAGRWITDHIRPGEKVALPSALMLPNPQLPPHAALLEWLYGSRFALRLRSYGLGVPGQAIRTAYLLDVVSRHRPGWLSGRRFVVTADHPAILSGLNTPAEVFENLRTAGARPVATFRGTPEVSASSLIYDQLDAEYAPLRGTVERAGPNLGIWDVEPAASAAVGEGR